MKNNIQMDKTYNPKSFEDKIYDKWIKADSFASTYSDDKQNFSMMLPPPNITAQLHMGHAYNHTLQDIIARFRRLEGYNVLWLPGTDHASIATELKVWEELEEKGISKSSVSREEFLEHAWAWKEKCEKTILSQMEKLGDSVDMNKLRFTMDKGCNKAVEKYFIDMYNDGLIFRGERMINWCVSCKTSLSDVEVEHVDKDGNFYHVNYKIDSSDEYIEIATTRVETILGDTAICVHPSDERYKHLHGKYAIVPLVNRKVKIICDEYVDMELGTGALKVTPAHDINDFALGQKHNIESINIFNLDGTLNENAGKYEGLSREIARTKVSEELKKQGLLIKVVSHKHNVGTCYRCHKIVEPTVSTQWFAKMDKFAKEGLRLLNKELFFHPKRYEKTYISWLDGIRDWCISRQLWWGHRIPAYYCQECDEIHVASEMPEICKCGSSNFVQDEDVLDTWFSSALWPFSTLGWPDETEDMERFFPNNALVTAYDIIFFWVARMCFASLYNLKKLPFKDVLIHGIVRDENGIKMSKSLGNGIDPLEIIENYGADALRFMLLTGSSLGADQKFRVERLEKSRNFANKIWNASRFVLMGIESFDYDLDKDDKLILCDRWILTRADIVSKKIFEYSAKYQYDKAGDLLYEFVWNEYCDWYIELAKERLYSDDKALKSTVSKVLVNVLRRILLLIQPFMPFVSEEIWSNISNEILMLKTWEDLESSLVFPESVEKMEFIMKAITNIRNARSEMDIPPSKKAKLLVYTTEDSSIFKDNQNYFKNLSSVSEIEVLKEDIENPSDMILTIVDKNKLYLPLDDLIDYEKEKLRLEKELEKLEFEIQRIEKQLSNKGFVMNAPSSVVDEAKQKLLNYEKSKSEIEPAYQKLISKIKTTK